MQILKNLATRQALFDRLLTRFRDFAEGLGCKYTRRRKWGPIQTFLVLCMGHIESSSVSGCPWKTAVNRVHKAAGEMFGWGSQEAPSMRSFLKSRVKLAEMDETHVWNQFQTHYTNAEHPQGARVGRFRLLHGDGMQFHVPRTEETVRQIGVQHNGHCLETHYPQAKLVLLMEGGSGLLVDQELVRCKDKATADQSSLKFEEKQAIAAFVEKMQSDDCLVWDSGGASLPLFANMQSAGKNFIMAISKAWKLAHIARARRRKDMVIDYEIPKANFPQLARERGSIRLRIVQVTDSHGKAKYLVTNILDELTLGQIRKAFRQRWAIETAFRYAKDYLGARILRSKTMVGIKQEMMAILAIIHMAAHLQLLVICEANSIRDMLSFLDKGIKRPRMQETFDLVLDLLLVAGSPRRSADLSSRAWKAYCIALSDPYIVHPGRMADRISKTPHGFFKPRRDSQTQRQAKGQRAQQN